jgi:hypothetical protein
MNQNENSFELHFKGGNIQVQRHQIERQTIYRIAFSDKRPPLVLTRATGTDTGKHWTSIPEGRLNEAEEIGPLIQEHIK